MVCSEDGLPTWVCQVLVTKPTLEEAIEVGPVATAMPAHAGLCQRASSRQARPGAGLALPVGSVVSGEARCRPCLAAGRASQHVAHACAAYTPAPCIQSRHLPLLRVAFVIHRLHSTCRGDELVCLSLCSGWRRLRRTSSSTWSLTPDEPRPGGGPPPALRCAGRAPAAPCAWAPQLRCQILGSGAPRRSPALVECAVPVASTPHFPSRPPIHWSRPTCRLPARIFAVFGQGGKVPGAWLRSSKPAAHHLLWCHLYSIQN